MFITVTYLQQSALGVKAHSGKHCDTSTWINVLREEKLSFI